MKRIATLLFLSLLPIPATFSQTAHRNLLAEIKQIKAIDNHAHAMSSASDQEFDAIACGGLQFVSTPPMRLRLESYTGAWRALYGYTGKEDLSQSSVREFLSLKQRVMREQGDDYPTWVLGQLNIETMLVNRVRPAKTLPSPQFRWVGYGDPLMLPLSTRTLRAADTDQQFFYKQEEKLLHDYLRAANVPQLPATLDQYLTRVVTPSLERMKREGAVAVKFAAAYMRPLNFDNTPASVAARIYARYRFRGEPSAIEYKQLQDFLFRYLAREAGRLGLVVHIHTGGGCGHYYSLSNGNPLLLESVLNDPQFRKTNFVLIHGGYPFVQEAAFLLEKPNVYADFSAQTFLLTPAALSRVLRSWLEYEPEKVLFATDASPATPEVSWEESAWFTNKTAREALAIALTGMVDDGDISRTRALELARMVLRENAAKLYGF